MSAPIQPGSHKFGPDSATLLVRTSRQGAASKAGHEKHPAWFHNLRAHPDVTFAGIPMRATVVEEEAERERLWTLADRVFAPYAAYRREAA